MAQRPAQSQITLQSNSTPGMEVRSINGVAFGSDQPSDFPVTVPLSQGSVTIVDAQSGCVIYDEPAGQVHGLGVGVEAPHGSFSFTLWDGITESSAFTCSINLRGAATPPQVAMHAGDAIQSNGAVVYYV